MCVCMCTWIFLYAVCVLCWKRVHNHPCMHVCIVYIRMPKICGHTNSLHLHARAYTYAHLSLWLHVLSLFMQDVCLFPYTCLVSICISICVVYDLVRKSYPSLRSMRWICICIKYAHLHMYISIHIIHIYAYTPRCICTYILYNPCPHACTRAYISMYLL
jgi:hypothetical protein